MKLALVGVNHRTAPIEVRERLAYADDKLRSALHELLSHVKVREALILSTCNRVEITTHLGQEERASERLLNYLAESHGLAPALVRPHLYLYEDADAIRHVFRVAASLDSMVVGEPQILGQLKQAFAVARQEGAVGRLLQAVITRAFSVAKRVRSETDIGGAAVSVSYAAVELAKEIFGSLQRKRVLVIGAGEMADLTVRHLRRQGAAELFVSNRTEEHATQLASSFEGRVIPYLEAPERLREVDIVIASSAAPHFVVSPEAARRALEARRNQPMLFIDIAVPRNIDPAVNKIDQAFLFDIDDLQRVVDRNLQGRKEVAEQAEEIVAAEVDRLLTQLRAHEVTPTIVSFQEQLEAIRQAELARFRAKLGPLTLEQDRAIEALTRGIVNKIAHGPISELRREAGVTDGNGQPAPEVVSVVRRLFGLRERT